MSEKMTFRRRLDCDEKAHVGSITARQQGHPSPTVAMLVLIIDNDHDAALGAATRLRGAGHQVLVEHDGTGGLARAVEQRPDVILLDLHMPTTDGLTTLRWLREHAATAQIPIVAFSADESMRSQAQFTGASHFVSKPYDVRQLADDLQSVVAGTAPGRRQLRKLNIQVATQRLQQDVTRVQESLGRLNNSFKDVFEDSDEIDELALRE